MTLDPVHVPAGGGDTVFLVGDTYTTLLTGAQTGGPAKMLFLYNPAGMEGMFAEIGSPGVRGQIGPPLSEADVAAMIGVSAKYHFTVSPPPEA